VILRASPHSRSKRIAICVCKNGLGCRPASRGVRDSLYALREDGRTLVEVPDVTCQWESSALNSQSDINIEPTVPRDRTEVRLWELFQVFLVLGASSFGGGLSGWMHREIVEKRQWISMDEFLTGLSLARTMPGINAINLGIWIGYVLRQGAGAFAAACGMLAGPMVLIVLCAMLYNRWGQSEPVHQVLLGIAAAALGLTLSLAFKSLRPAITHWFYAVIVVLIFVAIGLLKWPMLPVIGVLGPLSIGWAFFAENSDAG
jgi:chromate transporter